MTIRIITVGVLFGPIFLAALAEWIGEQIKN